MNKKIILSLVVVMMISFVLSPVHAEENENDEKKEIVRVQCDANGTVTKIKVEDFLKLKDKTNSIIDFSMLDNIKNIEGDEEYTQKKDGTLIWENHGENISYQGESHQPLPIDVKVTYYLDDKEIKPEDLIGKSGKVKIRFDYTNTTNQKVIVNGEELYVHIPFLCASVLMLPTDTFSNVTVSHGKILDNKDEMIVMGMAFPEMKEDLKLTDYEVTQDIDLPDSVEVTADVENFELAFTATLVSTIGLNDITELDDFSHFTSRIKQFTQASSKLLTATNSLNQGIILMNQYFNQYFNGVETLNQGLETMENSLYTLKVKKQSLDDGLSKVNQKLSQLKKGFNSFSVSKDQQDALNAVSSLLSDLETLSQTISIYQSNLAELETFIQETEKYQELMKVYQSHFKNDFNSIHLQNIENDATVQAQQKMKNIIDNSSLTKEQKDELLKEVSLIHITGITDETSKYMQSIQNTLNEMSKLEMPHLHSIDFTTLKTLMVNIKNQENVLSAYLSALDGDTDIQDLLTDLSSEIDNILSLTNGLTTLSEAVDQLYTITKNLSDGSQKLVSSQKELKQGMINLTTSMNSFTDGYRTFDQNAVQKLGNYAGADLENIISRFQAIQKVEEQYNNYSGIQEEYEGSVVFIYETDEIKK